MTDHPPVLAPFPATAQTAATAPAAISVPAELDTLAAVLRPACSTTVVLAPGRPYLAVICRHTGAGADVYASPSGWYWWRWNEHLAPTSDPDTAARDIITALAHATPAQDRQ